SRILKIRAWRWCHTDGLVFATDVKIRMGMDARGSTQQRRFKAKQIAKLQNS
ncbi:hypothetical protein HMPREF9554_02577, partial [Treponema phagedenis F0421]